MNGQLAAKQNQYEQGIGKPFQKPNWRDVAVCHRHGSFRNVLCGLESDGRQGYRFFRAFLFRRRHNYIPFGIYAR